MEYSLVLKSEFCSISFVLVDGLCNSNHFVHRLNQKWSDRNAVHDWSIKTSIWQHQQNIHTCRKSRSLKCGLEFLAMRPQFKWHLYCRRYVFQKQPILEEISSCKAFLSTLHYQHKDRPEMLRTMCLEQTLLLSFWGEISTSIALSSTQIEIFKWLSSAHFKGHVLPSLSSSFFIRLKLFSPLEFWHVAKVLILNGHVFVSFDLIEALLCPSIPYNNCGLTCEISKFWLNCVEIWQFLRAAWLFHRSVAGIKNTTASSNIWWEKSA